MYRCSICDLPFKNTYDAMVHEYSHKSNGYEHLCVTCLKVFSSQATLSRHNALVDCWFDPVEHSCPKCFTVYLTHKGLTQHIEKYDDIGISCKHNHRECDYCEKIFVSVDYKLRHLVDCEFTPVNISDSLYDYFQRVEERRIASRPMRLYRKNVLREEEIERYTAASAQLKALPPRVELDLPRLEDEYDDDVIIDDEDMVIDEIVIDSDEEGFEYDSEEEREISQNYVNIEQDRRSRKDTLAYLRAARQPRY